MSVKTKKVLTYNLLLKVTHFNNQAKTKGKKHINIL